MDRLISRISQPQRRQPALSNPYYRPTQKLREDADAMLRDMAYVLKLTQRVKESILEERELPEPTLA